VAGFVIEPESVDVSTVVCPTTGVTAREAAVGALVARDHLVGPGDEAPRAASTTARRITMIEDIRVLTGVLAMELATGEPATHGRYDPAHRAALAHEATMRSESFALCAAVTLVGLDLDAGRPEGS
jgi:hypothetical protein